MEEANSINNQQHFLIVSAGKLIIENAFRLKQQVNPVSGLKETLQIDTYVSFSGGTLGCEVIHVA